MRMFGNNNSNNGFNSNNQQESGTVQQVYAQRLQVIYQKVIIAISYIPMLIFEFAPNKLGNIPKVMQKYRGNEHAMYIKVCQKYRINPQNQYTGGNMGGNSTGSNIMNVLPSFQNFKRHDFAFFVFDHLLLRHVRKLWGFLVWK